MSAGDLFVVVVSVLFLGGMAVMLRGTRGVPSGGDEDAAQGDARRSRDRERRS